MLGFFFFSPLGFLIGWESIGNIGPHYPFKDPSCSKIHIQWLPLEPESDQHNEQRTTVEDSTTEKAVLVHWEECGIPYINFKCSLRAQCFRGESALTQ